MPSFGRSMLQHWLLDPDGVYLNHGTVGAPPRQVLAAQQAIRDEIERQPARFMLRELADVRQIPMRMKPRMRTAAEHVAAFVGARPEDFAFVTNATEGVNAVLRSFPLQPGDELLLTDHGYGAVTNTATYVAQRTGGTVRVLELPEARWDGAEIADVIVGAIGPKTRILVVDHVTSPTALILPVKEIIRRSHEAGVKVLVDGAHAPGALPLDVPPLGADWYVANLHKWAMSPRSAGFLWASPETQQDLHPTTISWGLGKGMDAEFDLTGTRDPSPWLASPAGIDFMRGIGLDEMRAHNHTFAWGAATMLSARWGTRLMTDECMVGTMATIPMPEKFGTGADDAQRLKDALLYEDRIEAQVHSFKGRMWVRISGQVYNDASDVERFAASVERHAGK